MADLPCPLCGASHQHPFHQDRRREYRRCDQCQLVFVPPEQYLSPEAEKAEYDLHQNRPDDPGYRRFLGRLFDPLLERLTPASQGLDFGCGPGPALARMFTEAGHAVALYDAFYAPDPRVLERQYDFITATEVVEHLHHPGRELDRLWELLRPGGWLGLMTKRVIDQTAFAAWHYKNDQTHVCFFSEATFDWLAGRWLTSAEFIDKDVVLLRKPSRPDGPHPR